MSVYCDWLTVWLTWVYRRTSCGRYHAYSRSAAGSVPWLIWHQRGSHSLDDVVHVSQAVDPAADHHNSIMTSARTSVSTVHLMWQHVIILMNPPLLLLLPLRMVCITTALLNSLLSSTTTTARLLNHFGHWLVTLTCVWGGKLLNWKHAFEGIEIKM